MSAKHLNKNLRSIGALGTILTSTMTALPALAADIYSLRVDPIAVTHNMTTGSTSNSLATGFLTVQDARCASSMPPGYRPRDPLYGYSGVPYLNWLSVDFNYALPGSAAPIAGYIHFLDASRGDNTAFPCLSSAHVETPVRAFMSFASQTDFFEEFCRSRGAGVHYSGYTTTANYSSPLFVPTVDPDLEEFPPSSAHLPEPRWWSSHILIANLTGVLAPLTFDITCETPRITPENPDDSGEKKLPQGSMK